MREVCKRAVSVLSLMASLALGGCASVPEIVKAMAVDPASACVEVKAVLYGHIRYCRSATLGAAILGVTPDGMAIQHKGGK